MNCKSIVKNSATNQALVRCNVNCKQKRAQGKEEPKSIEKTSATNQALVRCNAFCKQNKTRANRSLHCSKYSQNASIDPILE